MFGTRPDFTGLPLSVTQGRESSARVRVEIDGEQVSRTTQSDGRETQWCAPLSSFDSVNLYAEVRYVPGIESALSVIWRGRFGTVFTVALWHSGTSRPIAVWRTGSTFAARSAWRDLARTLGLPAVESSPAGYAVREAADFEKSLRELAAEGKVAVPLVSPDRPPSGIETKRDGANILVQIGTSYQRRTVVLTPENLICPARARFWDLTPRPMRLDAIRAIVVPALEEPTGEEEDVPWTGLIDRMAGLTLSHRLGFAPRPSLRALASAGTTEVHVVSGDDNIVIGDLRPGEADWLAKHIMAAVAEDLPG